MEYNNGIILPFIIIILPICVVWTHSLGDVGVHEADIIKILVPTVESPRASQTGRAPLYLRQ